MEERNVGVRYRPYEKKMEQQPPREPQVHTGKRPFTRTWLVPFLFMVLHMIVLNLAAVGFSVVDILRRIASGHTVESAEDIFEMVDLIKLQTYGSIGACLVLIPIYLFYIRGRKRIDPATLLQGSNTSPRKYFYVLAMTFIGLSLTHLMVLSLQGLAHFVPYISNKLQEYQKIAEMIAGESLPWYVNLLSTVILVPIAEDLLFRGIVMGAFLPVMKPSRAIILSGVLFGLFHMNFVQSLYVMPIGLLLGWVYWKTKNLVYPIFFHMLYNFFGGFLPVLIIGDNEQRALYYLFSTLTVTILSLIVLFATRRKRFQA